MKKILCITENLGSGGAERQLTGLAVMLKQRGYNVKFITYIKKQFYLDFLIENAVDYELIEKAGCKYTRVFYLISAIKRFQPDVVISFLPSPSISMCLVKILGLGLNFKLIVSERSATQELNIRNRLVFFLYSFADIVTTNSYSEALYIKKNFKTLESKVHAITNYTDTDYFTPPSNIDFGHVSLLVVGRVIKDKNTIQFLQAVRKVLDSGYFLSVKWVGSQHDTEYCKQVFAEILRLKLSDVVEMKNHTKSVLEEYKSANVFCLPSLFEGYPNVVCEAMSCGLPVLCSNVNDNSMIVENGRNGYLFDPLSAESIAKSIITFIKLSDNDKKELSEQSRIMAVGKFDKSVFIDKFIELL